MTGKITEQRADRQEVRSAGERAGGNLGQR
jgi:hypothetical protein